MPVESPYADQLDRIPVRERSLIVDGAETRFWDYGDHEASTTIVMVHGFRGDHHGLEPVVAQLSGFRIIAPDLPGFGSSAPFPAATHSVEGYAAWLGRFIEELHLTGRVVLLGHSFGSIVSSAAVAGGLRPDDLVLVNPIAAPALQGPRGVLTRLAVFYYWSSAKLPKRLGFAFLRNKGVVRIMSVAMAKTKDPALRRWIHAQHDQYFSAFADREVVLESFTASVSHDVSEYADRITMPTLLVGAEKDPITSVKQVRELHARIPGSELVMIPGVGHLVHYETPRAAAEAILPFLGGGSLQA